MGFIVEIIQNISAFVGQKVSTISTAISGMGEFFGGDFFTDLLAFFAVPLGMIKNYLSNFPYAVLVVVVINLFLVVVILALAEKMLGVFDALDRASIANQLKQFFGRAIITPKVRKPVVAQDIIRPNAENHIAPPISFAQAFITVSLLAFLAYSLPQKYQLANLTQNHQNNQTQVAGETQGNPDNQDLMNLTPTENLSALQESHPNLYQLLTSSESRRGSASSLQLGMITINPKGQIFLLPKSISSREIKNYVIKNIDIADHAITSRTIKNHTIRSIDLKRDLTIEELKIDHNLTVRGNLTTEGTLIAADMNLSGNLDLQNNLILNIGNQNTDFTASGGLNLAGNLNINNNFLVNAVTGNITTGTINGNTITNGTGTLTLDSYTLTLTSNSQLNQSLLTTSTPQFTRLGLGISADTTNILTATSSSTTDLSKTLNISHTGIITGTGYAGYFSKTGASTTNVGLYTIATGATNNYALQVDSAVVGATNYTIYANGVAKNYFAGNIGIGSTAPGARLQVVGTDSLNTSFAANIAGATGTGLIVTNSGNVGIGTTAPNMGLELYKAGSPQFQINMGTGSSGSANMYFSEANVQKTYMQYFGSGHASAGLFKIYNTGGDMQLLDASGAGGLYLKSGNVGIGTTGPGSLLTVAGTIRSDSSGTPEVYLNKIGTRGWSIRNDGAFNIYNWETATNQLTVLNSGNVGIGTTGPSAKLDVSGGYMRALGGVGGGATPSGGKGLEMTFSSDTNVGYILGYNRDTSTRLDMSLGNTSNPLYLQGISGNVGIGSTGPGARLQVVGADDLSTSFAAKLGGATTTGLIITNSGNVGIGTTSPGYNLTVVGNAGINSSANGVAALSFNTSNANAGSRNWSIYNEAYNYGDFAITSGASQGAAPSLIRLIINNSGNVGIGTTAPDSKLTIVQDTGLTNPALKIIGSAGDPGNYFMSVQPFLDSSFGIGYQFKLKNVYGPNFDGTVMTLNGSGNVGIGTTGPASKLHIMNTGSGISKIAALLTNNDGTAGTETQLAFTTLNADPASNRYGYIGYVINGVNGGDMRFATNVAGAGPVEAMRINNLGNVGIGSTGPGARLQVVGADDLSTSFAAKLGGATTTGLIITNSGNVGIGTTGPGYKLDVSGGDIAIEGSGKLWWPGGGVYLTESGGIKYVGNATHPMNVSGAALLVGYAGDGATSYAAGNALISGNVGIGTTGPTKALEVVGDYMSRATDKIGFRYTGAGDTSYSYLTNTSNVLTLVGGMWTSTATQEAIRFSTRVSDTLTAALSILNNGNVGIGTTGPGTRLWVQQSEETYNGGIGIQSANGSSARIWKDTLDNLAFSRGTNGAAMVLSLGGNLGIGQNVPGSALSVNGGISAGTYSATAAPSGGMIISGNVGIGTTNPVLAKLQIEGSVAGEVVGLAITNTNNTQNNLSTIQFGTYSASYTAAISARNRKDIETAGSELAFFTRGVSGTMSEKMTISPNGNVGIGNVAPLSKLGITGNASIGATYGAIAAPTSGLIIEGNVGIGTTDPRRY